MEPGAEFPVLYSSFPLASYFTHGRVYMSMLSHLVPSSPSLAVSISLQGSVFIE